MLADFVSFAAPQIMVGAFFRRAPSALYAPIPAKIQHVASDAYSCFARRAARGPGSSGIWIDVPISIITFLNHLWVCPNIIVGAALASHCTDAYRPQSSWLLGHLHIVRERGQKSPKCPVPTKSGAQKRKMVRGTLNPRARERTDPAADSMMPMMTRKRASLKGRPRTWRGELAPFCAKRTMSRNLIVRSQASLRDGS